MSGYGFCGKAVAERLKALGARVTVLARRREVRKEAKRAGFYAVDFAFGRREAMGAAMLGKHRAGAGHYAQHYPGTSEGCLYFRYCVRTGRNRFCLCEGIRNPGGSIPGLPGRYAPKESAYILDRAIERFVSGKEDV